MPAELPPFIAKTFLLKCAYDSMGDIFRWILRDVSEKIFLRISPGDWFLNLEAATWGVL